MIWKTSFSVQCLFHWKILQLSNIKHIYGGTTLNGWRTKNVSYSKKRRSCSRYTNNKTMKLTAVLEYEITMVMIVMYRSSPLEMLYKIGLFENFTKFTGKHLCQNFFFSKVATLSRNYSGTRTFLWTLTNFQEHLFYKIPPADCFHM